MPVIISRSLYSFSSSFVAGSSISLTETKPAPDPLFRKAEKRLLRPIENLFRRIRLIEALRHDFVRGVDNLPEHRFLANDLDVVLDIDQMRNAVEQTRQITDAACAFELRGADEFFLNRDEIDGSRPFDQLDHLPKNHAMRIEIEIFGPKSLDNPVIIFVVYEN